MSKYYEPKVIVEGLPTFEVPLEDILRQVKLGGALRVLTPLEYHTDRQRRWYKGVALPWLVKHDENRESTACWDREVKRLCDGLNLLKVQYILLDDGTVVARLTIVDVGKKNMTQFINEILAKSVELNWGLAPPDEELRTL